MCDAPDFDGESIVIFNALADIDIELGALIFAMGALIFAMLQSF